MRLYTRREFEGELLRRGCQRIERQTATTAVWKAPDGHFFLVPILEEGRYPDWLLDQVIHTNRLSESRLQ